MGDKDRIENAIRHIQTATDIDPWAMEIAMDAMRRMMNADDDLISRRAAIDALCEICDRPKHPDWVYTDEFCRALGALPSVQSDRKTGHWIPQDFNDSDGMIATAVYYFPKCSVCGIASNYTNFCPNCGADMRGDTDE